MGETDLPLILVSASNVTKPSKFISELIDNEVEDSVNKKYNGRVWQIVNKYYRADVEVCLAIDGEPVTQIEDVEAHIIFIADEEDKEGAERIAEERWTQAVGAPSAHVRLLICDGEDATPQPALSTWARRRRYELIQLRESPDDDYETGPFPETFGVERARAALHAYTWRGLERLDHPTGVRSPPEVELDSADEDDVERAEEFAEALGALGEARGAAITLSDGERRRHAERVVAAFCRALGVDLPAL